MLSRVIKLLVIGIVLLLTFGPLGANFTLTQASSSSGQTDIFIPKALAQSSNQLAIVVASSYPYTVNGSQGSSSLTVPVNLSGTAARYPVTVTAAVSGNVSGISFSVSHQPNPFNQGDTNNSAIINVDTTNIGSNPSSVNGQTATMTFSAPGAATVTSTITLSYNSSAPAGALNPTTGQPNSSAPPCSFGILDALTSLDIGTTIVQIVSCVFNSIVQGITNIIQTVLQTVTGLSDLPRKDILESRQYAILPTYRLTIT